MVPLSLHWGCLPPKICPSELLKNCKLVQDIEVENANSGILEHLLELVNELQIYLKLMLEELVFLKNEVTLLPKAIDLGKVLRKLKLDLKHLISEHQKVTEMIGTIKDDSVLAHSSPTKAKDTNINLSKFSILKFDSDILNWRTCWKQLEVSVHNRDQLLDTEELAYVKDALKDSAAERIIQGLAQMAGTYDEATECLLSWYDQPRLIHKDHVCAILDVLSLKEGSEKELRFSMI